MAEPTNNLNNTSELLQNKNITPNPKEEPEEHLKRFPRVLAVILVTISGLPALIVAIASSITFFGSPPKTYNNVLVNAFLIGIITGIAVGIIAFHSKINKMHALWSFIALTIIVTILCSIIMLNAGVEGPGRENTAKVTALLPALAVILAGFLVIPFKPLKETNDKHFIFILRLTGIVLLLVGLTSFVGFKMISPRGTLADIEQAIYSLEDGNPVIAEYGKATSDESIRYGTYLENKIPITEFIVRMNSRLPDGTISKCGATPPIENNVSYYYYQTHGSQTCIFFSKNWFGQPKYRGYVTIDPDYRNSDLAAEITINLNNTIPPVGLPDWA